MHHDRRQARTSTRRTGAFRALSHADLPTLDATALRSEIEGAQDRIEAELGQRPVTFCYPFGHHDPTIRRAVRAAGLRLAFTMEKGAWESTGRPLRAPRVWVMAWHAPEDVLTRVQRFESGQ